MNLSQMLQPQDWPRPSGYSNGVLAHGRQVFIAGQVGWDPLTRLFSSETLVDQVGQALKNMLTVLAEADGRPQHVVRMNWYFTNRAEYLSYLKQIGAVYRDIMGTHFPAMTAIEVPALIEAAAKVEIEATAVIP